MEKYFFENFINQFLVPPMLKLYSGGKKYNSLSFKYLQMLINSQEDSIFKLWKNYLDYKFDSANVFLLGMPTDNNCYSKGCAIGPQIIRELFYTTFSSPDFSLCDLGDIKTIPQLFDDSLLNNEAITEYNYLLYNQSSSNLPVSPISIASHFIHNFFDLYPDKKLLLMGGDSSISFPFIKNFIHQQKKQKKTPVIIEFTNQSRFNKTNNLLINKIFNNDNIQNVIQFGISENNCNNEINTSRSFTQIKTSEILRSDIQTICNDALAQLEKFNRPQIYFSIDINVFSKSYINRTDYNSESEGIDLFSVLMIIKKISSVYNVCIIDLVEWAPFTQNLNDVLLPPAICQNTVNSILMTSLNALGQRHAE